MEISDFDWEDKLGCPARRFQSRLIDVLITAALYGSCLALFKVSGLDSVLFDVLVIAIPFSYFTLADALPNGQSLGKRLLGLSVVSRKTGKSCVLWRALIRNAFTPVLVIIDTIMMFSPARQRLGDKLAGTVVVRMA